MRGVPMAVIAAQLGHADTRTTKSTICPPGAVIYGENGILCL